MDADHWKQTGKERYICKEQSQGGGTPERSAEQKAMEIGLIEKTGGGGGVSEGFSISCLLWV